VGQNQAATNAQSAGAITTVSETVRSQEVSKQKKIERLLRKIHENCKIDGLGERVPIRLTNNMDGALVNYEVMLNADKINIACFDKHAVECQSDFKQLREKYKNDKSMENKYRTYTLFLNK